MVQQPTRFLSGYGSLLETLANIFAPGVGGAIVDAAEGVAQHVEHTSTGSADGVWDAIDQAGQAVERISRSESQQSQGESTTTTETTETTQSLTRTFTNPYRDRSMKLRFLPVFRHFEVRTWPASVTPGISMQVGAIRLGGRTTVSIRDLLADATTRVDPGALQQPLANMLASNQQARLARGTASPATGSTGAPNPANALLWSRSTVREDSILVPLTDPETAANAFGLDGQSHTAFVDTLDRIQPDVVVDLVPVKTQQVLLFIGTHVEPVAGECVLQDVPAISISPTATA